MMIRKGYYSEPLEILPGRLHVTHDRISLELMLTDREGKRGIASMTLCKTSGISVIADWKECCDRSAKGETCEVDTGERTLITGAHPEITIFKSFGALKSETAATRIKDEVDRAYRRGEEVQKFLFHNEDIMDAALTDQDDAAGAQGEEKPERRKRPRIQREKQRTGINLEKTSPKDSRNSTLSGIVEALEERLEAPETPAEKAPEAESVADLTGMPDMNNYDNLGTAPYLGMIRNLSFNRSDTDVLRSKAVMLLSVMDFVAAGKITSAKIVPTKLLSQKYMSTWTKNIGRTCTKSFMQAFYMLNDERFWSIVSSMTENTESIIKGVRYARIDDELFKAMQNGGNRGKIRLILSARCK